MIACWIGKESMDANIAAASFNLSGEVLNLKVNMTPLNLPTFDHQLQTREGKTVIFDLVRRKYVVLTPEEWVRQHFIHYLVRERQYPKSLMRIEGGLRYNRTARRSDILVYQRDGTAFMVIECKAPSVPLSPQVFEQVAVYNQTLRAEYVTVTNGMSHYCCRMDYEAGSYTFLKDLPTYV